MKNDTLSTTPRSLTAAQVQALLTLTGATLATKHVDEVAKLILNTGLRSMELCQLRWDDVDLSNLTLRVPASRSNAVRFIPILPEVLTVLLNLKGDHSSEYVFGERRQAFLRAVDDQLANLGLKIGVSRLHLHSLRHTFAARLVGAGVDPAVLLAIGGWKSFTSVLSYYPTA